MPNYLKIIILPSITVLALAAIWIFIKPTYDEARTLSQNKLPQLESLFEQENDLQQRTEKLAGEENVTQTDIIMDALPESQEIKSLITQIEFIVGKENMTLNSINIDDQNSSEAALSGVLSQQSTDIYKEITGSIEVKGGYGQFKQLLVDFEKISRIIDISSLDIINSSNSGDNSSTSNGKYTLNFKAFWQPSIDPSDIRAALENQESGGSTPSAPGLPALSSSPSSSPMNNIE